MGGDGCTAERRVKVHCLRLRTWATARRYLGEPRIRGRFDGPACWPMPGSPRCDEQKSVVAADVLDRSKRDKGWDGRDREGWDGQNPWS